MPLDPVRIPQTVSRWAFDNDELDEDLVNSELLDVEEFEGMPGLEASDRA